MSTTAHRRLVAYADRAAKDTSIPAKRLVDERVELVRTKGFFGLSRMKRQAVRREVLVGWELWSNHMRVMERSDPRATWLEVTSRALLWLATDGRLMHVEREETLEAGHSTSRIIAAEEATAGQLQDPDYRWYGRTHSAHGEKTTTYERGETLYSGKPYVGVSAAITRIVQPAKRH